MRKLVAVLVVLVGSLAVAQTAHPTTPPREKEIVFDENDLISGETTKPDVEHFQTGPQAAHESLLKPRTEFREKVLESVHEL